jgi:hypothetical protein
METNYNFFLMQKFHSPKDVSDYAERKITDLYNESNT